jgi:hypothetical protein
MHLLNRCLTSASLLLLVSTATFAQFGGMGPTGAQDDTDLIDDVPKDGKEATRENIQPPRKKQVRGRPKVDLIDDVAPAQKEAAEREAAKKHENAIPDNLADALARALHNSPGILVAEAKVRQAQAELNEVRLSVVQELTLAFQRRAINRSMPPGQVNLQTSTTILEDEAKILYLLGVGAEHASEAPQASTGSRSKGGLSGSMMGAGMGMTPDLGGGMGPMGGMAPMGGGMGGMMRGGAMGGGPMGGGMGGVPAPKGRGERRLSELPENARAFLDKRLTSTCIRHH